MKNPTNNTRDGDCNESAAREAINAHQGRAIATPDE
jgi:hypothetical protein